MERKLYKEFSEIYGDHWWFRGRLKILESVLNLYVRPLAAKKPISILDVGCGTGSYFSILSGYGEVFGTESDDSAIQELIARKVPAEIYKAVLPHMDLKRTFDVVTAFEILEHVGEDELAIKNIFDHLPGGGLLIGTVPAYQWLWSKHDELAHHKRRYTGHMLSRRLENVGFTVVKISYYNTFLFPVAAPIRLLKKAILKNILPVSDFSTTAGPLDKVFEAIFASERFWLKNLNFPFGFSLLFVASKSIK